MNLDRSAMECEVCLTTAAKLFDLRSQPSQPRAAAANKPYGWKAQAVVASTVDNPLTFTFNFSHAEKRFGPVTFSFAVLKMQAKV